MKNTAYNYKFIGLLAANLLLSFLLAKMDCTPGWDDTGLTASLVTLTSLVFGWLMPHRAWLWAVITAALIIIFNIVIYQSYGAILVLAFSFAGAYSGVFFRKIIFRKGINI